ncbi:uncharacterized protein L969DRAFT_69634 [Mixia osmundae IAM 14324]|uniref:uncharacterized protein n=1 Tax=Mixia osmundae (strain CBS 9802 / IAM 14324 / JCM 22182 / KY 12970) TaxID=764103 RepID=UPI0004A54C8B|nr:uncharacterized protein L969DRAFT_69634 [Mixia osmundae IAM 14324]KEI42510.1 hypothetical protein L969DRAFT_69634 [Mixia osmundae IAM 14324]
MSALEGEPQIVDDSMVDGGAAPNDGDEQVSTGYVSKEEADGLSKDNILPEGTSRNKSKPAYQDDDALDAAVEEASAADLSATETLKVDDCPSNMHSEHRQTCLPQAWRSLPRCAFSYENVRAYRNFQMALAKLLAELLSPHKAAQPATFRPFPSLPSQLPRSSPANRNEMSGLEGEPQIVTDAMSKGGAGPADGDEQVSTGYVSKGKSAGGGASVLSKKNILPDGASRKTASHDYKQDEDDLDNEVASRTNAEPQVEYTRS